jgi:hypothetical protein
MFRNTEKFHKQQKKRTKDRAVGQGKKHTLFKHVKKADVRNIFNVIMKENMQRKASKAIRDSGGKGRGDSIF